MAVSVNGNKKIATLQKEFNEQFPYLKIVIYKGSTPVSGAKTLAQVRTKTGGGNISINGNKKIASLENEFKTDFGLKVQVAYTTKKSVTIVTSYSDHNTLAHWNKYIGSCGDCKKGVWK